MRAVIRKDKPMKYLLIVTLLVCGCIEVDVDQDNKQENAQRAVESSSKPNEFEVCLGANQYDYCATTEWEGACVDGWCHCYADAQCIDGSANRACVSGVCVSTD